jgi:hypothetical protein
MSNTMSVAAALDPADLLPALAADAVARVDRGVLERRRRVSTSRRVGWRSSGGLLADGEIVKVTAVAAVLESVLANGKDLVASRALLEDARRSLQKLLTLADAPQPSSPPGVWSINS